MRMFNFGNKSDKGDFGGLVPFEAGGLESIFDDFFKGPLFIPGFFGFGKTPAIDMYEKGNKFIIKAELPGVEKENIRLKLDNGVLTISANRKRERELKKDGYYHIERNYGVIQRSISLPEGVKESDIKASYKDGVLSIEAPIDRGLIDRGRSIDIQ